MKKWILVLTVSGGFMVFDFDSEQQAQAQRRIFVSDDLEAGPIKAMQIGFNMNWICPICDGGPGNFCNCNCPSER